MSDMKTGFLNWIRRAFYEEEYAIVGAMVLAYALQLTVGLPVSKIIYCIQEGALEYLVNYFVDSIYKNK